LITIRTYVTTGVLEPQRPPDRTFGWRMVFAPALTHSAHWWPTEASRMHSGQM
jgi:hypothetical protein